MKIHYLIIFYFICFNVNAQQNESIIKINKEKHLTDLPSASGVEVINGNIYVIGDDSPYLYQLNNDFSIIDKMLITGNDSISGRRVPKAIKSDFESMASFSDGNDILLVVLSSGSKEVTRDTIHIISTLSNKVLLSKNIRPLFDVIRIKADFLESDEINMEAMAINETNVFIMQRGNNNKNIIVSFDRNSFMNYLYSDDTQIPEMNIYWFTLPTLENTISGFSGACFLPDNTALLFTASLEATSNAYDDGEILGSYLGIINLTNIENDKIKTELLSIDNKPIKTKLEGLSVKAMNNNNATVIAVSDNDDGTSWIFEFELNINQFFNK